MTVKNVGPAGRKALAFSPSPYHDPSRSDVRLTRCESRRVLKLRAQRKFKWSGKPRRAQAGSDSWQ